MQRILFVIAALSVCPLSSAPAQVLYDGSLGGGIETPDDQGWLYVAVPSGGATNTAGGGITRLNTTLLSNATQAGYGRFDTPVDLSGDGVTLSFRARLVSESHASSDRAGFSVIAMSSDANPIGIELGFWADEIWAQHDTPLFTHAEGVPFDTVNKMVKYDLALVGGVYRLYADDVFMFSGPLRDYSAFAGFPDPYDVANSLFFGDDTTSARAIVDITRIELLAAAVPEPATAALLAIGGLFALKRRRRK